MLDVMKELIRVIEEGRSLYGATIVEWSKLEDMGFPYLPVELVNASQLEEVIDYAIENNTMSMDDIVKLVKIQTLMEVL